MGFGQATVTTVCGLSLSHTGIDFSRDGCYMALAERRDCKDYVSIFVCDDWHLLRVSRTLLFFSFSFIAIHTP